MSCCYRDGKGWCKNLDRVYTDADGKDYCVFHAPQGEKRVLLEKFNERVFERIREAQRQDEPCDLSGTVFEGDVSFSQFDKDHPLPDINFSNAQFSKIVDFMGARFSNKAHFKETHFSEAVLFIETRFSGDTDFSDALFNGGSFFEETHFNGKTKFMNAQFSKDVFFENTRFSKNTNFRFVRIGKGGSVHFRNTSFSKRAVFDNLHILEKARLIFWNSDETKTFLEKSSFMLLDIEGSLVFERVDLSKALFSNTQMRNIDFVNIKWSRLGWRGWRNVLYDEIDLFEGIKKGSGEDDNRPKTFYAKYLYFKGWLTGECHGDDIRKVEILYRRMKNKYRTLQNWPEVSNWHYGEKEMYRKENAFRRYFPLSFSFLYWLSSGYGERYVRAGVALGVLIVILSLGLAWTGLDATGVLGSNHGDFHGITSITLKTLDLKSIGALLINTLKYATFQKDIIFFPRNMWGEIVRLLAQILIPIQTALFIMAVRNRFRR